MLNSATEQIKDNKKNYLDSKKRKMERELSEAKKDIYKELAKPVERYGNTHYPKVQR